MRTIKGKPIHVEDCKEGDIISLTPGVQMDENAHLNIVVKPSLLLVNKLMKDEFAFNVISLNDGRPRTFHPLSPVYIFKKEDVFQ